MSNQYYEIMYLNIFLNVIMPYISQHVLLCICHCVATMTLLIEYELYGLLIDLFINVIWYYYIFLY